MSEDKSAPRRIATTLVHKGRDPAAQHGFVNTPVYRGSTVLYKDMATVESGKQQFTYGREGSPTMRGLEEALAEIEGGHRTILTPSGLGAVTTALLSFLGAGDHILVTDSVYRPTRHFCDDFLKRMGIETTYYDPLLGAGIAALLRPNTKVIYVESPGSQTFEIQDIPAIAAVSKAHGLVLMMDNTWATPLFYKPFAHGVDISIQAGTKYIVGHADAMLGVITANERTAERLVKNTWMLGSCAGTEEMFLGTRGLRTMGIRMAHHHSAALEMAHWLKARLEVAEVLHPGLPGAPGHDMWKRDFTGASGLFSIVLKPAPKAGVRAMLDGLKLFGMGFSWGGFESLIVPFDPREYRTASTWTHPGQALRLHIGLEDLDDLKDDLAAGFVRLQAAAG